jgi:hypothetical protein
MVAASASPTIPRKPYLARPPDQRDLLGYKLSGAAVVNTTEVRSELKPPYFPSTPPPPP